MTIFKHFRLLPLLVIVAALSFSMRFGEFITGVQEYGQAQAAKQNEPEDEAAHGEEHESGDMMAEEMHEDTGGKNAPKENYASGFSSMGQKEDITDKWRDASEVDYSYSEVQAELESDLSARRRKLEEWEQRLSMKEAQLQVAERELDQKISELTVIKQRIEAVMSDREEKQNKRITSLVKIYEGMKSKEAARIFDTLDMEILIQVMSGMSERKLSPILAAMNPDRARAVTALLAAQNQLPSISQN